MPCNSLNINVYQLTSEAKVSLCISLQIAKLKLLGICQVIKLTQSAIKTAPAVLLFLMELLVLMETVQDQYSCIGVMKDTHSWGTQIEHV